VGLRELHVAVRDDVEPVAPGITDAVAADARAVLPGSREHARHVIDDKPEMAVLAPWLDLVLGQSDELIAQVDERHPTRAAAQLQIREQRTPDRERALDAAHVERDVVDPDRTLYDATLGSV